MFLFTTSMYMFIVTIKNKIIIEIIKQVDIKYGQVKCVNIYSIGCLSSRKINSNRKDHGIINPTRSSDNKVLNIFFIFFWLNCNVYCDIAVINDVNKKYNRI